MKKINYIIVCIYFLSLIFLYPGVAHILMYELGYMVDTLPHGRFWMFIQIFLSAPGLIVLGLLLYFTYGGFLLNKFFGGVFTLIGAYWFYALVAEIIKEAA